MLVESGRSARWRNVDFFDFVIGAPQLAFFTFLLLEQSMSIYVGNLAYTIAEADLTETFGEYGTVKRVQVPTDRETGKPRGFAFVEMSTDAEEDAAIEALNGAEWMGRDLRVNKARPKEDRGGRGGGGGGGGGGWGGRD
jgi:RNA recognition motif-containing protein